MQPPVGGSDVGNYYKAVVEHSLVCAQCPDPCMCCMCAHMFTCVLHVCAYVCCICVRMCAHVCVACVRICYAIVFLLTARREALGRIQDRKLERLLRVVENQRQRLHAKEHNLANLQRNLIHAEVELEEQEQSIVQERNVARQELRSVQREQV